MIAIKKIKEVCEIVGVSRRTLQEYDRIHLLEHTSVNKSGHWLYDEDAIRKLITIQIFVEAGYTRNEIREILNPLVLSHSKQDVIDEYDKLLKGLKEKRDHINGLIKAVELLESVCDEPDEIIHAIGTLKMDDLYKEKSFKDTLNDLIEQFPQLNEAACEEVSYRVSLLLKLVTVASMKDQDPHSEQVQNYMRYVYIMLMRSLLPEHGTDILTDQEKERIITKRICETGNVEKLMEVFVEILRDTVLPDPSIAEELHKKCGDDAEEYILRAAEIFGRNIISSAGS